MAISTETYYIQSAETSDFKTMKKICVIAVVENLLRLHRTSSYCCHSSIHFIYKETSQNERNARITSLPSISSSSHHQGDIEEVKRFRRLSFSDTPKKVNKIVDLRSYLINRIRRFLV